MEIRIIKFGDIEIQKQKFQKAEDRFRSKI